MPEEYSRTRQDKCPIARLQIQMRGYSQGWQRCRGMPWPSHVRTHASPPHGDGEARLLGVCLLTICPLARAQSHRTKERGRFGEIWRQGCPRASCRRVVVELQRPVLPDSCESTKAAHAVMVLDSWPLSATEALPFDFPHVKSMSDLVVFACRRDINHSELPRRLGGALHLSFPSFFLDQA
ncbi:hypothetical protein B0T11DRAFT_80831 [Plectosphaerella cucumerina]|uniref:Uncharacterized protein n=1 Tax=Plectosphaerella cucumerina TaxID=40658 RepID=A0A8K0TCI0_9PEZI|nr:hypothetical protein B0T11DRAFT_80831 [Plectosphaerella cucumerina]